MQLLYSTVASHYIRLLSSCLTVELTELPPVSDTIVVPNAFDEKLVGGNSGLTIY